MSLFAKIMVVVNLILAVVFLSAAGTVLNATESWKAQYAQLDKAKVDEALSLNAQVEAQRDQKDAAKAAQSEAEKAKVAAEEKLAVLQSSNEAVHSHNQKLEAALQTLSTAQSDMQQKNSDLQGLVENLRGDLSRSEGEKRDANDTIQTLQEQIAGISQQLEDAQASLASQEAANMAQAEQIDGLKTTVAMYKKEKGPLAGGTPVKPLNAVVQAVDNPNDLYILSVGSKDGVMEGWEFTIYRGGEYVATVVVDKVFGNYASARTKDGLKKMDAQAGDSASTIL